MKKLGLVLSFFLSFSILTAQENFTIKGETLQLKTEVEGELDLLWNIIDGHYRYFIRTSDDSITELVNTRDENRHFQNEYKMTLENITGVSANNVNLTLNDLKRYLDSYNLSQDSNYQTTIYNAKLKLLLGVFGGITNSPFINNPDNAIAPQFGAELELLDANRIKRHALFMEFRHVFKTNDFEYTTTEIAMGYRFRIINKRSFSLFGQTKFGTLNFSKNTIVGPNDLAIDVKETIFNVPFTFGIGADIRLTGSSFLMIRYNELFAALIENKGNFSTNLTLGYKFNL